METYVFKNIKKITPNVSKCKNVLVQAFISAWKDDGTTDYDAVYEIIENLKRRIPHAKLIGASAGDKIIHGKIQKYENLFIVSTFDSSIIDTLIIESSSNISHSIKSSVTTLQDKFKSELLPNFLSSNPKFKKTITDDPIVTLCFADAININGDEIVNAINKYLPGTKLAGGLASDEKRFQETFVFTEDGVSTKGIVLGNIYSSEVNTSLIRRSNWQGFGLKLKVTKSDNNRVYELDNLPIIEMYEEILGIKLSNDLREVYLGFPLIVGEGTDSVGRAIMSIDREDKCLIFAGSVPQGCMVQFGIANIDDILDLKNEDFLSEDMEVFFVYSCVLRRALIGIEIQNETLKLQNRAQTHGFFSYGEFYNNGDSNSFLNLSMTGLGLAEGEVKPKKSAAYIPQVNGSSLNHKTKVNIIKYLSNKLSKERQNNLELQTIIKNLNKS